MLANDSRDYALIDQLAEEFAARFRDGERPSIQEYCDRYPHIADDLREMLPALAEVEHVKDEVQAQPAPEMPKLRQVGEYHILREVGRGGMGVVYEAEQMTLGRRVALKVLAAGKSGHGLERFKREARAAARLHHTNIVPVFGVGDYEGMPYYVMQFIQGLGVDEVLDEVKRLQTASGSSVSLSSLNPKSARKDISAAVVARSLMTGTFEPPPPANAAETVTHHPAADSNDDVGRISNPSSHGSSSSISLPGHTNTTGRKPSYWQSVAQIGLQVADALDYAHKQGVLHRDIKPSNLLLDMHGVVWVTDFGLAKADDQENLTNTGDVLGTVRYMPPEAFEGKSDPRSDVYSLGLTIYELLALRPGYDERKREQLVKQVTTTEPPRLGGLNRSIPRDLQTIVHKAIEKDPNHRYKSAGDLAADLRRFLSDQPILARRISPVERFTRWCKRNPTIAGLTAAVFMLMTAVAIVSSVLAMRIERKADEARNEANRANDEANRANEETEKAKLAQQKEINERRRTQRLLAEQLVHRGSEMLAAGDVAGGALCFAHALAADIDDPDESRLHRTRLAAALRDSPRPRHILFHSANVARLGLSDDSKHLVTACEDGTIQVWDIAAGQRVGKAIKLDSTVRQVSFSPNGQRIWTTTDSKTPKADTQLDPVPDLNGSGGSRVVTYELTLWDWQTGESIVRMERGSPINLMSEGSDELIGNKSQPNVLELRDPNTGQIVGPPIQTPGTIVSLYASKQAGRVLTSYRVPVEPEKKADPDDPEPKQPKAKGKFGRTPTRTVWQLWDPLTGKPVGAELPFGNGSPVFAGPRSRFLVVRIGDSLQWFDSATGEKGPSYACEGFTINAYRPSSDQRRIAVIMNRVRTAADGSDRGFSPGGGSSGPGSEIHVLDSRTAQLVQITPASYEARGMSQELTVNRDASRFLFESSNGLSLLLPSGTVQSLTERSSGGGRLRSSSTISRFSPDGAYVLTVGSDHSARIWRTYDGSAATPRWPHPGPVGNALFSPDGSQVVTSSGGAVWIWPMQRTEIDRGVVLRNETGTTPRLLSANGQRILEYNLSVAYRSRFGGHARVFDATTGQVLHGPVELPSWMAEDVNWRLGPSSSGVVEMRADGKAVLFRKSVPLQRRGDPQAAEEDTNPEFLLWDCTSGLLIPLPLKERLPKERLPGESVSGGPVSRQSVFATTRFSPDGRFIRTRQVDGEHFEFLLLDATTGQPAGAAIRVARPANESRAVTPSDCWRPDSSLLIWRETANDEVRLHRYDTRSGQPIGSPVILPGVASAHVAFNDSGTRFLTIDSQRSSGRGFRELVGSVRVWDAQTGEPLGPPINALRLGGNITQAILNPTGTQVALVVRYGSASDPFLGGGDRGFGTESASGTVVHLWDVASDTVLSTPLVHDWPLSQVCFSPDGQRLVTSTRLDRRVRIWSTISGELLRVIDAGASSTSIAISDDGRRLVTRGFLPLAPDESGNVPGIQVWDVSTGQPLTPPLRPGTAGLLGGNRIAADPFFSSATGPPVWSRDLQRLLVLRGDGAHTVYELSAEPGDVAELIAQAEVLSARRINSAGLVQTMLPGYLREQWQTIGGRQVDRWPDNAVTGSAWHLHQNALDSGFGSRSMTSDRGAARLWHLDRLLAETPDNASHHAARGSILQRRGDYAEAEAAYTRAIELSKAADDDRSPFDLQSRAATRIAMGKWADAEQDLVKALERDRATAEPVSPGGIFARAQRLRLTPRTNLALVRLRLGDEAGYRALCQDLKEDLLGPQPKNKGTGPIGGVFLGTAFRVILARPNAVPDLPKLAAEDADLDEILPILRLGGGPEGGGFGGQSLPRYTLRGMLRYRQGRHEEALKYLARAGGGAELGGFDGFGGFGGRDDPAAFYFLAMAQHQLGKPEAKETLQKAQELHEREAAQTRRDTANPPDAFGGGRRGFGLTGWQGDVVNDQLRKEAEALILGKK